MKIGDKHKFRDGTIGTLIEKNGNYGLFLFENGSKYCFNILGLKSENN